jgi:hypothetical protein
MMNQLKIKRDQIQKIALSSVGFVFLLYVYFSFFLGPLNRSRDTMLAAMKDKQTKLDSSKGDMSKATVLEQQVKTATTRFAAFKALNPEGAPIAWFPPRIKVFFANQHIDKAAARLEGSVGFKQPELADWLKYSWLIDLPQADYATVGKAIADLENSEPLLSIAKLSIHSLQDQPQFQQVNLVATNIIPKK